MTLAHHLLFTIAALTLTGFTAAGCGGQKQRAHVFTYAQEQPAGSLRGESMVFFQQQLQQRSGGRIRVELYCGGVLGTERDVMDLVATGALQGTRGAFFADANPKYKIMTMPFLVEDWEQAIRLARSPFMGDINRQASDRGWHVPATGISQGFRAHTNSVRPIRRPADLRGLRMRVPAQDVLIRTAIAFGANPVEIPAVEIYQALQTGVVDGQDNPPSNIWDYKIYEVSEYLSVTNYATGPDPLLVNLTWYQSLPEDLQAIFDQVARETMALSDQLYRDQEQEYLSRLADKLQVNYVTGEALQEFREAVRPVYEHYIQQGELTAAEIAAARAAARSPKEPGG